MNENFVYNALYLHYIDGKSIAEVSNITGLRIRVVSDIAKGVKMPSVATNFFADRKKEDFSRVYDKSEHRYLNKFEFEKF